MCHSPPPKPPPAASHSHSHPHAVPATAQAIPKLSCWSPGRFPWPERALLILTEERSRAGPPVSSRIPECRANAPAIFHTALLLCQLFIVLISRGLRAGMIYSLPDISPSSDEHRIPALTWDALPLTRGCETDSGCRGHQQPLTRPSTGSKRSPAGHHLYRRLPKYRKLPTLCYIFLPLFSILGLHV